MITGDRRIPESFTELLGASLLFWLEGLDPSVARARPGSRERLVRALELPRGTTLNWPVQACELAMRAQLSIDGMPRGLDKQTILDATEATWPRADAEIFAEAHDWRARADCGAL